LHPLIIAGFLAIPAQVYFSCAGSAGSTENSIVINGMEKSSVTKTTEWERQRTPTLIVESPQEAVYNGEGRTLSFSYSGNDEPEIFYYPSLLAREEERGGSRLPPVRVGTYYALIRCNYAEASVEFRILKSPVKIVTAKKQEAIFNGNPRRVEAEAVPPVPLSYSYYPNRELMDAAIKAEEEASLNRDPAEALTEIFKGYKRIDQAPSQQGTYFVWIYFPGDENHLMAQTVVEFNIEPPPRAAPRQR